MPTTTLPVIKRSYCEHRLARSKKAKAALVSMGKNVRLLRGKLSREELGEAVGCSQQMIGHIEDARHFPSWPVYLALCEYFRTGKPALT